MDFTFGDDQDEQQSTEEIQCAEMATHCLHMLWKKVMYTICCSLIPDSKFALDTYLRLKIIKICSQDVTM